MTNWRRLVLIVLAFTPVTEALAGHEWSDGTMGPPQGRGYDTTMPIFPSTRVTSSTPAEAPSVACGRSIPPNHEADVTVAPSPAVRLRQSSDATTVQPTRAPDSAADNTEKLETCSGHAR
jgi:hypothetical protein